MENKHENRTDNADLIAGSLKAENREIKREHARKLNKMWLWLGILFLIAIVLWFIFGLGLFESFTK